MGQQLHSGAAQEQVLGGGMALPGEDSLHNDEELILQWEPVKDSGRVTTEVVLSF